MKKMMLLLVMFLAVSAKAQISAPGDIDGLYLHLEADSLALSNGAAITSWVDSANGYDFTGTATFDGYYANGHAAVYFDGVADQLVNQALVSAPNPASTTMFIVGNFTSEELKVEHEYMISAQWPESNSANRFRLLKGRDDGLWDVRVGSGSTISNRPSDAEKHIFAIVSGQSGNSVEFLVDNVSFGTTTSGTPEVLQGLGLGSYHRDGSGFADCSVAEIILYDSALTAQQVSDVTAYLQAKYADMTQAQADAGTGVDVTLEWSALADLDNYPQINPGLLNQYVYVTKDQNVSDDPNFYYHGTGAVVSGLTSDYTAADLNYSGSYKAAVVFEMAAYSPVVGVSQLSDVAPANVIGPEISFITIAQDAQISPVSPSYAAVDAASGQSVVLSVDEELSVDTYQWFLIGDPVDLELEDGAKYQGTDTNVLTINDVELADEGTYYCIASNDVPSSASNRDTGPCRVMTHRLTSHYPFETTFVEGTDSISPDTVGGYDAVLMAEGSRALPELDNIDHIDSLLGNYLNLDNADQIEDPNGQYAMLPAGVIDYEDITISFWLRPNGGTSFNWARVFDFGFDQETNLFFTPDNGAGSAVFRIREPGTVRSLSTGWLSAGSWYHIAITIGGDTGNMYIDGKLIATNTNMTLNPIDLGATSNYIGKSFWPDPELNAYLDELKIFNYALTQEEVIDLSYDVLQTAICLGELEYDVAGGGELGDQPDCRVDLADFAAFAGDWLNCNLYPVCE